NALLEKYLTEEGRYPESVGIVVWGTSAMRTQGDDIAEILWLLGVRPVWMKENRRVTGLELIPLDELRRPRIDVTVRISGFFRDAFPNLVHLIDDAVRMVAQADEGEDENLVAAHFRRDGETEEALYRIFDSDDYMQYHGGMIATIRALTGKNPRQFFGDSANPSLVRVRDLDDEARRVFRSRVINPKWIESVKRHGYKGAFELAATVDY